MGPGQVAVAHGGPRQPDDPLTPVRTPHRARHAVGAHVEPGAVGVPAPKATVAEVDGNRTRRSGIARPTRFEGGGSHQVCGHLRRRAYWSAYFDMGGGSRPTLPAMKKIVVILVVLALAALAVKKLQDA